MVRRRSWSPLADLIAFALLATTAVSCSPSGEEDRSQVVNHSGLDPASVNVSPLGPDVKLPLVSNIADQRASVDNAGGQLPAQFEPPQDERMGREHDAKFDVIVSQRAQTLYSAGKNLEDLGKNNGAIQFYQQTVMECRGTAESVQSIRRLKALGGRVPTQCESLPVKVPDPWSPPHPRPRYASTEEYGRKIDQMINNALQSTIQGGRIQTYFPPRQSPGGHFCGAPCEDGHPCQRWVVSSDHCYQHGG